MVKPSSKLFLAKSYLVAWKFRILSFDLPPVVVPSFKLELGSSQARDPGGAWRSQDLWESPVWPRVRVAYNPMHCEALPYCIPAASTLSGSGLPSGGRK